MTRFMQQTVITATFKTYPDIGHGTNGKMNSEIADFFKKISGSNIKTLTPHQLHC